MASKSGKTGSILATTDESVGRLYERILEESSSESEGPDTGDSTMEERFDEIIDALFDEDVEFDRSFVTDNLESILLLFARLKDDETHGMGLIREIDAVFDVELSPGIVYPKLHELQEEGLLRNQELVHTKVYNVTDESETTTRIDDATRQHLVLGFMYARVLGEL